LDLSMFEVSSISLGLNRSLQHLDEFSTFS
jgi:hypothetical protein